MTNIILSKRREIEEAVCNIFRRVSSDNANLSWSRRVTIVAAETGLSTSGINKILNRCGIFNNRNSSANG